MSSVSERFPKNIYSIGVYFGPGEGYVGVNRSEISAKTGKYLRFYRHFPLVLGMQLAPLFRNSNRQYINYNISQKCSNVAKITQGS